MEQAKEAISLVASDMLGLLKNGVDVKSIVGDHPWASTGAALAAGFLVASAITPARDETLAERLRSLMPEMPAEPVTASGDSPTAKAVDADAKKRGIMAAITSQLADALKTAVITTLSSAISAKVAKEPEAPEPAKGNGNT